MPWPIAAIMAGSSILSGILGARKRQEQQRQWGSSQQNTANEQYQTGFSNRYTTPTYDTKAQTYRDELINQALGRLQSPLTDPTQAARSIVTGQIQNINQLGGLQQRILNNQLRQRGLSYSPMGAYAGAVGDTNRMSQIIQVQNMLPQLQRQYELENENLMGQRQQLASQLFGMLPYGTAQESTDWAHNVGFGQNTESYDRYGLGTEPGNMWGGGLTSLAALLARLWGQGAFTGRGGLGNLELPRQGSGEGYP